MARFENPPYYITAYGLAVKRGYKGTLDEWLASLKGKSAYAYAVEAGYEGTEEEFAAMLLGGKVQSVNGQTGRVVLTAENVGADPSGTAESKVSGHNTSAEAHNDLRIELKELAERLNAFFDSDDTTLDELSEIVEYIKSNKSLIDAITTSKVSVSDIIDNLITNVSNKPLSAAQGVVLKGMIDDLNMGKKELLIVTLTGQDSGEYSADATYMEIAHAKASDKLVLLRYGAYITHILAGEPTESSFLFEPLLHSVEGMPGYTVDISDNWSTVAVTTPGSGGEAVSEIFTVTLEETGDGKYSASTTYMEIAQARALGNLVLLRYGVYITHILAGEPTESSFLFEPLLHSVPGMPGYIVDIQDNWSTAVFTRDEVLVSDITTTIDKDSTDEEIPSAKAVYDAMKKKGSGVYVLGEGETLEDVPADVTVVVDPYGDADMTIEQIVATTLEVIENGTY